MMNSNWDITVQKVASHINGINHVKRISELANVKPEWARQSMEHMMQVYSSSREIQDH
jgi:hypothetical protein